MKNKAEILKAIDTCIFLGGSCRDCPYFDVLDCVNQISKDLHALLSKSDFEVMKEILNRSKEAGYHHYTAMSGRECLEIPFLRFDEEGNIL